MEERHERGRDDRRVHQWPRQERRARQDVQRRRKRSCSALTSSSDSSGTWSTSDSDSESRRRRHIRPNSGHRRERVTKRRNQASRKSRKAADTDGANMSPNTASNGLGEGTVAQQAEMRATREHVLGSTPSNVLGDQASQPRPTLSETINIVRATPTMAPELTTPLLSSLRQREPSESGLFTTVHFLFIKVAQKANDRN